jgi:SAM-dependent methyltransferase
VLTADAPRDSLEFLPGDVSEVISPNDLMIKSQTREHYFFAGRSALRCIRLALLCAAAESPRRILDLPSGHGRVLRTLRAAFPDSEITACDTDRDGVDFCAAELGAIPVYSHDEPSLIELDGRFDLIWCGSLLTHLPASRWSDFLRFFREHLEPAGILVFTTHGRCVVDRLRSGRYTYGLDEAAVEPLLSEIRSGFGYADYPGRNGYGISVSLPGWVGSVLAEHEELRLVLYLEKGWNSHQDVVACMRQ